MKNPLFPFLISLFIITGCNSHQKPAPNTEPKLQPFIEIDGSSSVFPIAQEISTMYNDLHPEVKISLSLSGTTNGFMKLCQGRLDINNASREIKPDEISTCLNNGVELLELKIANDAIVVAVNNANTWCNGLSIEQLRKLWTKTKNGSVMKWSDIDPLWPDKAIKYCSPGKLSGTQNVFLSILLGDHEVNAQQGITSEDHNDVVSYVSQDTMAIGYFSMPFLRSNTQFVRPVAIDDLNDYNGFGQILPTIEAIENKQYHPFARPLFLYINKKALLNPTYCNYLRFFLENVRDHSVSLGYAPLTPTELSEQILKLETACSENNATSR
jgi:phosphate transport system substrate-binding protein